MVLSLLRNLGLSSGKVVAITLVMGVLALTVLLFFVSEGLFRQSQLFLEEKTEATVVFRNVNGSVLLVGVVGNSGVNPTLVMRTGDFRMELTVINEDTSPHRLFVDGMNISTKTLRTGESETITLVSENEATYNYYDQLGGSAPIGQIKALKVTAYD